MLLKVDSKTPHPPTSEEVERLLKIEPRVEFPDEPRIARIASHDVWQMRVLVSAGLLAVAAFFGFLLLGAKIGEPWLYWPVVVVFGFFSLLSLYEWFCYLGVKPKKFNPRSKRNWIVDVLTTWCPGEPKDMVVATLKSIQRMPYPHSTFLCDEGDDPALREVCARLGVHHITREKKVGAKAGNINNALRSASGDIVVIMDPDHETAPYFLDRIVGFFDNEKVGFVQHVQAYYNQEESLVALGAAQQTYHFYGPSQTGMDGHGTTQAIGANCAFRRAALDSIGGHATGLAEDMATTLKIYAQNWTSVFSPEILTRGQVPATYSGYCKQQLKWACGVWDILFESFPNAFFKISWQNRLHYIMNGLFYCRGLFFLVGALIPVVSLFTGFVPLEITIKEFLLWFGPLFAAQILIRQSAQRWLLEPEERGLHLVGGFLMNSVWLIHLRGVLSSVLRVKIPYIPTPKDDAATNAWSLALPNILLVLVSTVAIVYGLSWDWSPYAGIMAAFALTNIISLGTISLAAQQKLSASLGLKQVTNMFRLDVLEHGLRACALGLCWALRRQTLFYALVVVGLVAAWSGTETPRAHYDRVVERISGNSDMDNRGFHMGLYVRQMDEAAAGMISIERAISEVVEIQDALATDFSIVSLYLWWGERALSSFPAEALSEIQNQGAVPMITWGPSLADFDWTAKWQSEAPLPNVFRLITDGKMDEFLAGHAIRIREHGGPVLMRFAHEMDNPQYPWSAVGGSTPDEFVAAWRYVVEYFDGMGATNVGWVWNPWKSTDMDTYYPGDSYVDWVGLTILNYGGGGSWQSFSELYNPYVEWVIERQKPVMLAEFGSTDYDGNREAWIVDALAEIEKRPEIEGAVLFDSADDENWPEVWGEGPSNFKIDWRIDPTSEILRGSLANFAAERPLFQPAPSLPKPEATEQNRVEQIPDGWQLTVDGEPFFIRGVAYGTGGDWKDPKAVSRNSIEQDFREIAAMGANTIRHYHRQWGDQNILRAARANGLKVLAGIWLDPDVDYLADKAALDRLEEDALAMVRDLKDDPNIIMWIIGNGAWGAMHHSQPKLTDMRRAYIRFVDRLAGAIKEMDSDRPVATAIDASGEIAGELWEISTHAPTVDVIGVNAYYATHLDKLRHNMAHFAGAKPWFLSEFGPDGYWDEFHSSRSRTGFALEPSDQEKATQYVTRWRDHVEANRPSTLGGVAFSWSDRAEGTTTWFGLTDFGGRKKPAYYALHELWNESPMQNTAMAVSLKLVADQEILEPGGVLNLHLGANDWPSECSVLLELIDEKTLRVDYRRELACGDADLPLNMPESTGRYRVVARALFGEQMTATASLAIVLK